MINMKKLKIFTAATAVVFTGFLASVTNTFAAENVAVTSINFDSNIVNGDAVGQEFVLLSLDGGISWYKLPVESNKFTFDISSVSASKDSVIMVKGYDNHYASPTAIKLKKENAVDFSLKYDPLTGMVKSNKDNYYSYRTSVNVGWNDENNISQGQTKEKILFTKGIGVSLLEYNGGNFYVKRSGSVISTALSNKTDCELERPSKVLTFKIPAQAKAPAVKVDYLNGKLTGISDKMQYTVKNLTTGQYYENAQMTQSTTGAVWITPSVSQKIIDLAEFAKVSDFKIEVRVAVTSGKKESRSIEYILSKSTDKINSNKIEDGLMFDYHTEMLQTFPTSSGALEYVIVKEEDASKVSSEPSTVKWTKVTFNTGKGISLTSKISALKVDSVLFVRSVGDKNKCLLPGQITKYKMEKRPVISAKDVAKVDFIQEIIILNNCEDDSNRSIIVASDKNFTTDKNVFTPQQSTEGILVTSLAAIDSLDYKTKTFYYRVICTEATKSAVSAYDFVGKPASLTKTLSVPARSKTTPAKVKNYYDDNKRILYLQNKVQYKRIDSEEWTDVIFENSKMKTAQIARDEFAESMDATQLSVRFIPTTKVFASMPLTIDVIKDLTTIDSISFGLNVAGAIPIAGIPLYESNKISLPVSINYESDKDVKAILAFNDSSKVYSGVPCVGEVQLTIPPNYSLDLSSISSLDDIKSIIVFEDEMTAQIVGYEVKNGYTDRGVITLFVLVNAQ